MSTLQKNTSDTSPVLFLNAKGEPMRFYIRPGPIKVQFQPLITSGGGVLCRTQEPSAILLADPGEISSAAEGVGQFYISTQYILDCVTRNQQLDIERYRFINLQPVQTRKASQKRRAEHGRMSYSLEDDTAILKFIDKHRNDAKGNRIWQEMERQRIINHSWQSMKDRFLKHLQHKQVSKSSWKKVCQVTSPKQKVSKRVDVISSSDTDNTQIKQPDEREPEPSSKISRSSHCTAEEMTQPEQPSADPEQLSADPEQPSADPEQPSAAPEQPSAAPEHLSAAPEHLSAAPEQPSAAPEHLSAAPEHLSAAPEQPSADLEPPSAEPERPAADPEPPSAEPEPPSAEPERPATEPHSEQNQVPLSEEGNQQYQKSGEQPNTSNEKDGTDAKAGGDFLHGPKEKSTASSKRPQGRKTSERKLGILERAAREFEDSQPIDDGSQEDQPQSQASTHSSDTDEAQIMAARTRALREQDVNTECLENEERLVAEAQGNRSQNLQRHKDDCAGPSSGAVPITSIAHLFLYQQESQEDLSQPSEQERVAPELLEAQQQVVSLMQKSKKDLVEVTKALLTASGDPTLALMFLQEEYDPEVHGLIWTKSDDELLLSSDSSEHDLLFEKYGTKDVARRLAFLTEN